MSLYLIASPRFNPDGSYRTRYYRECRDGRPRFSDKAEAYRATAEEAVAIISQLQGMAPQFTYAFLDDTNHPRRDLWANATRPPPPPEQGDAFE